MSGCAVCGAPGRACSGCRGVFYCGKEHQNSDWPQHKANCKPFKRSADPETGRKTRLVATRAIPAGSVVMRSRPLVVGPSGLQLSCLGCLRGLVELAGSTRRCSGCGLPVCSRKCEEESPHRVECGLLKSAGFRAGRFLFSSIMGCSLEWSTLALAVKVLRTLVRSDADKKKVLAQKSRLLLALTIPNTGKTLRDAAEMILQKMKMRQFAEDEVLQVADVWRMNQSTFSCQDGRAICGLHIGDYNMLTNSCTPNCAVSNDDPADASLVTVMAKKPIAVGETLTLMITNLECGTYVRKMDGRQVFFECDCARCLDPTELGLYMSSICCKKCRDRGVKSMMVCCNTQDKYYLESPWQCEECGFTMGFVEYFHFVNDTRMQLHALEHNANELRIFIGEQMWPKGLLHRTHEFIVRANLLLRDLCKDQLHTLVDPFRLLLEVVEKLDPWDSDSIEVLRSNLAEAVMESIQFDLALGKITPKEAEEMSLREVQKLQEPLKVLTMGGLKERRDDLVYQFGDVMPIATTMIKGPCVVCGAPGLTCPICESPEALYCTTGHRHRDWDRHKAECQKLAPTPTLSKETENGHLKLLLSSIHGLHVVAAKNIVNHELVVERQPVVVGPNFLCSAGPSPTLCLGCHVAVNYSTVRQCSSCGFPLCRKKCEKVSHHISECSALKRVRYVLSRANLEKWKQEPSVYAFRICLLRCALFLSEEKIAAPVVPGQDVFLKSDDGKQIQEASVWIQKELKLQNILSSEVIMKAGSLCQRRFIPVGEPVVKEVVALYPFNEHVLHSCVPNSCCIDADDDEDDQESFSSIVLAQRDIPVEEAITLPYISLALGTYSRRLILEHYDGCYCSRCLDKTELGLYVGNVCCEQCKGEGENPPKMVSVNPTDVLTENWVCEQCEFTLSKVTMQELHKDIFDKLRALKGENAELYQQFINDNLSPKGVLHPTHEAIIEAKREIVLKDVELQTRLPQDISSRNMSYCDDLLRFYAKVQPSSELLKDFQMILMRYVITSNKPENEV